MVVERTIADICVGIESSILSDGVCCQKSADPWVVVSVSCFVEPGLRIITVSGKAEAEAYGGGGRGFAERRVGVRA
jgi:hypothetical protein